jgi:hypothetical protein
MSNTGRRPDTRTKKHLTSDPTDVRQAQNQPFADLGHVPGTQVLRKLLFQFRAHVLAVVVQCGGLDDRSQPRPQDDLRDPIADQFPESGRSARQDRRPHECGATGTEPAPGVELPFARYAADQLDALDMSGDTRARAR